MSASEPATSRANATITVHKYEPAGFRANLGEGAEVHLDYWFE